MAVGPNKLEPQGTISGSREANARRAPLVVERTVYLSRIADRETATHTRAKHLRPFDATLTTQRR